MKQLEKLHKRGNKNFMNVLAVDLLHQYFDNHQKIFLAAHPVFKSTHIFLADNDLFFCKWS